MLFLLARACRYSQQPGSSPRHAREGGETARAQAKVLAAAAAPSRRRRAPAFSRRRPSAARQTSPDDRTTRSITLIKRQKVRAMPTGAYNMLKNSSERAGREALCASVQCTMLATCQNQLGKCHTKEKALKAGLRA